MRVFTAAAFLWLAIAPSAFASVLLEYDFTGEPGDQASTSPSWTATGVSASVFRRGFGNQPIGVLNSIAARDWTMGEVEPQLDYFEFVITPTGGAVLDVNEIAFSEQRNATGIRAFTLRSSLDDFRSDVISPIFVPDDGFVRDHALALGSAFDAISTPVAFRLYGYFSEGVLGRWAIINHSELGVFRVSGSISGIEPEDEPDSSPIAHAPEPTGIIIWGFCLNLALVGWGARHCRRPRNAIPASRSR